MRRFIARILLKALAIMCLFPLLKGLTFHGNFFSACGLAIFFSLLLSFLEMIASVIGGTLTLSTLGIALLVIIPARIIFFWVLPTLTLLLIGKILPNLLTIKNFYAAAIAALILLTISLITREKN